jgi:hypothetical protein
MTGGGLGVRVELAGAVVSGETAEVWEQSLGSSWWEWTVELGFSFLCSMWQTLRS